MADIETTVNQPAENTANTAPETVETPAENESAELAKLRADYAKMKAAMDKATSEAASMKKQLRAKQSAEEAAAEDAKALQQAMQEELEQLRKEKAVAGITAKVVGFTGSSDTAAQIAEYLYGAEDADAALDALTKAWSAKEKALRLEYGKITAPGIGSSEGSSVTKQQLDAMNYKQRLDFANKYPDEYNKLMGR